MDDPIDVDPSTHASFGSESATERETLRWEGFIPEETSDAPARFQGVVVFLLTQSAELKRTAHGVGMAAGFLPMVHLRFKWRSSRDR